MPTDQHAEQPEEHEPPPPLSRRNHRIPAAGDNAMTPEQRALRDAFLAELWPPCREVPFGEREANRKEQRRQQREMEDRRVAAGIPPDSPDISTGCAETALGKGSKGGAKCA